MKTHKAIQTFSVHFEHQNLGKNLLNILLLNSVMFSKHFFFTKLIMIYGKMLLNTNKFQMAIEELYLKDFSQKICETSSY